MSGIINAVIIESDPGNLRTLRDALTGLGFVQIIAETDSLVYGYELVRQNRPQLVFVDIRDEAWKSLEVMGKIATYFKDTFIVASGQDFTLETIMACMQAGAREYLPRPFQPDQITGLMSKHRGSLVVDSSGDKTGRILTVFSNKGGLGKTTIAVNLAISLSETIKKPVALVDLNLQLGDITTFLDITPKQTIVDIAKNIGRVDTSYLESSLAEFRNGDARVFVLADPLHVEEAEEVSAEQINTVLTVLKASFEYVIIDTTTSFDSKTLTALDLADNVLLCSMVNLPCIRSSQRVLNLFRRLGYDTQKIKLIINRYINDEEITIEDVEDTLEHPVFWKIPNSYQVVMTAINRGVPITQVDNSQSLVKNFRDFAHQISGVVTRAKADAFMSAGLSGSGDATKKQSKSLLPSLFGKK